MYTNGAAASGAALLPGGGSWSYFSDREIKENFTYVVQEEVLARLAEVPISTWNYRAQDASIRHMGPVAQDFYAAFGLGEDERLIATVHADGVALAAIQGLHGLARDQAVRLEQLEDENDALKAELEEIRERTDALERSDSDGGSGRPQARSVSGGWLGLVALVAVAGVWVLHRGPRGLSAIGFDGANTWITNTDDGTVSRR